MRLLVTAASRHGSTAEIATELAKPVRGALPGVDVDVVPPTRVGDLADYDAVVDYRDWPAVRAWAARIAADLRTRTVLGRRALDVPRLAGVDRSPDRDEDGTGVVTDDGEPDGGAVASRR